MVEAPQAGVGPRGVPLAHEAIVIGTGFGGAVTACRLAQAGFKPLIVERGRRYEKDDFPALPAEGALVPDLRRWTWEREQGLWDVLDLEEIVSIQAAGYGGGSLIYANVHLRPPKTVFDERWPTEYQGREQLDDYFDLAAYMLDVAPMGATRSSAETPIRPPTKARQLMLVGERLGRAGEVFHPPLAISRREGLNEHGRYQRVCVQCGKCCTGCPEEAKNTLSFNYLAEAERPEYGAYVMTQCEVIDIGKADARDRTGGSDERPWRVRCVDHLTAATCTFQARYVFVCAGS